MPKDDSGPAFPTDHFNRDKAVGGMTLRDWLAGQAMAAMLMRDTTVAPGRNGDEIVAAAQMRRKLRAKVAYMEADAMLAEREKEGEASDAVTPVEAVEAANNRTLSFLRNEGHYKAADALEKDLEVPF